MIKSKVFQISRRADPDRHLHLLCFIAHQYFHLHDLLIDVLLMAVQSARSTCQREQQNQYYDRHVKRQQAIHSLVENVEHTVCDPLAHIEKIAFQEQLPDNEKVRYIQDILQRQGPERQLLQRQIAQLKDDLQHDPEERAYYNALESRSVKLQNKVAEIVCQVPFQGNENTLLEAIRHFQAREGTVTYLAPTAFLSDEEQRLLTRENGKFRVSLYKALFFMKVADAVKSGTLNVEASYRYRSLDDYLIPQDQWERWRKDYLGVIAEASQNPTLSELMKVIQGLAQTFVCATFPASLKRRAIFVAQFSCQIGLNGNRYLQCPLT